MNVLFRNILKGGRVIGAGAIGDDGHLIGRMSFDLIALRECGVYCQKKKSSKNDASHD